MAIDSAGNVFVFGQSDSASEKRDCLTIRYNPSGSLAWPERYSAEGTSPETPRAIPVDITGNVNLTGTTLAPSTGRDWATVSYSLSGARRWVRRYGGSGSQTSSEKAPAIALEATGNVYNDRDARILARGGRCQDGLHEGLCRRNASGSAWDRPVNRDG